MTRGIQKFLLGTVLFVILSLGALCGAAGTPLLGFPAGASITHAGGCDNFPPQPGLE
jgi:hypothetical protein